MSTCVTASLNYNGSYFQVGVNYLNRGEYLHFQTRDVAGSIRRSFKTELEDLQAAQANVVNCG